MPSPSYEVTILDADGEEWPVRVFGDNMTESELWDAACLESARLTLEIPRWRPTQPYSLGPIEGWNGAEVRSPA